MRFASTLLLAIVPLALAIPIQNNVEDATAITATAPISGVTAHDAQGNVFKRQAAQIAQLQQILTDKGLNQADFVGLTWTPLVAYAITHGVPAGNIPTLPGGRRAVDTEEKRQVPAVPTKESLIAYLKGMGLNPNEFVNLAYTPLITYAINHGVPAGQIPTLPGGRRDLSGEGAIPNILTVQGLKELLKELGLPSASLDGKSYEELVKVLTKFLVGGLGGTGRRDIPNILTVQGLKQLLIEFGLPPASLDGKSYEELVDVLTKFTIGGLGGTGRRDIPNPLTIQGLKQLLIEFGLPPASLDGKSYEELVAVATKFSVGGFGGTGRESSA